jgi:hypothetical protein
MVMHNLIITPVRSTPFCVRTNCDGDYLLCVASGKKNYGKKLRKNKGEKLKKNEEKQSTV